MIFVGRATQCTHYCGRPEYYRGVGKDLSILGNPFKAEHSLDRDRVCDLYEEYFRNSMKEDTPFTDAVLQIARDYKDAGSDNVVLGCFCKPKKRCHCDTIVSYVKFLVEGK